MNIKTIKYVSSACIIALLTGCAAATNSAPVVETARIGAITQSIAAAGTIAASNEARLSFQQPGIVRSVSVVIGQTVNKGDMLAELDTIDLTLGLKQSEAQLALANNAIRNAEQSVIVALSNYSRTVQGAREVDLKAAEAGLASANANFTKVTRGQASDSAAAKVALDAAQANLDKLMAGPTREDLAVVQSQLSNAEASLRAAQFAYDNAFRRDPAGIGASPAAAQLEIATNNWNLAQASFDKAAKGADAAQLRSAEQQVAQARANVARFSGASDAANRSAAQQQIASAQASVERLKEPARDFDITQASAQVEQARIALDTAKTNAALSEIAVAQAKRRIEQAVVRAPFDGVIGSVNVREGESVSVAGAPASAFVLADPRGYHMDVTVDELDVARLQPGQVVATSIDALPGLTVSGKVERISSTSSKINGVVNYIVRVALEGGNDALKSGMSATARIVTGSNDKAVLVPALAVRRDAANGKSFVTVRSGEESRETEVVLGLRDGAQVEIISGLAEGASIVLR